MMLRLFLLLVLIPAVSAEVIAPTIYEQRDFGTPSLEEFTYSVSVDCTAATIRLYVMDESNKPVKDVGTFLKYIDFSQPLISSAETDKDGFVLHKLPGNVKLMRGFFVLVLQKNGFRNKEIHFDIVRCYSNETLPSPPKKEQPSVPEKNETEPENETVPVIPQPNITNTSNQTVNGSNQSVTEEEAPPQVCAPLLVLLTIFKFFRG